MPPICQFAYSYAKATARTIVYRTIAYHLACCTQDLADVVLTKPELEVASKVVCAEIVNHPQNDPDAPPAINPSRRGGACALQ